MEFFLRLADGITAGLPAALLIVGLYYGVRLRFFPITRPGRVLRGLSRHTPPAKTGKKAVSSRRALALSLAGTIGVGNITGVSLALAVGGPGAIFWMWVAAIAAMLLKYAEIVLAMDSRRPDGRGGWQGGTPRSFEAAGWPTAGALFAVLCIGETFLVGGMVQANTIAACTADCFALPPAVSGLLLVAAVLPAALGGREKTEQLTARLVPLMCGVYCLLAAGVILLRAPALPSVFARIFREAFHPTAAAGGTGGYLVFRAIRVGAARGLVSNEGGCGTSPMAHVTADEPHPARQGLFGVFEVFADTIVICTLTAVCILLAFPTLPEGVDGAALATLAFTAVLGRGAGDLLAVALILFAYATVVCASFYAQSCLAFFTKARPVSRFLSLLFLAALFLGAVLPAGPVWWSGDLLLSVMTYANLLLLIKKADRVVALSASYGLIDRPERPEAETPHRGDRTKLAPDHRARDKKLPPLKR